MAKESANLESKLKKSDPDVRYYVAKLKKLNATLHRQVLDMKAKAVDRDNRIKALEEQWKSKKVDIRYDINLERNPKEVARRIAFLQAQFLDDLRKQGYTITPPAAK